MTRHFVISTNGMDFDTLEAAEAIARACSVECNITECWYDDFTGKHGHRVVSVFKKA